jgi:serine/threonine protein phosphatase PrpC
MGNLLVAPVTDKETHRGETDDGQLAFAVSSMQGWRVHMEDAHILQASMYAEEAIKENGSEEIKMDANANGDSSSSSNNSAINGSATKRAKMNSGDRELETDGDEKNNNGQSRTKYNRLDLPQHSLFAVYDGHGGKFAAEYAGLNFVRVLARQAAFVQYAHFVNDLAARDASNASASAGTGTEGQSAGADTPQEKAESNRKGRELLETALKDAFLDIDREIWREVQGLGNKDSTLPNKKGKDQGERNGDDIDHEHEDDEWQKSDSGSTATVVMFTPQWIICANAGDSRSVYSKQGHCTIPLSYDHKPDDEAEERRVYEAGGFVRGGRVEGDLAVSRGLGDFRFKQDEMYQNMGTVPVSFAQYADVKGSGRKKGLVGPASVLSPEDQKVSPMPDIVLQNRNREHDEFVIVACDGIFDVLSNHECIALTADIFRQGESDLGLVCEEVRELL